jgi:hypothetical protein
MVTVSITAKALAAIEAITAKALAAIEATLPEGSEAEARRTVRASISLRCRGTSSTNLTT